MLNDFDKSVKINVNISSMNIASNAWNVTFNFVAKFILVKLSSFLWLSYLLQFYLFYLPFNAINNNIRVYLKNGAVWKNSRKKP